LLCGLVSPRYAGDAWCGFPARQNYGQRRATRALRWAARSRMFLIGGSVAAGIDGYRISRCPQAPAPPIHCDRSRPDRSVARQFISSVDDAAPVLAWRAASRRGLHHPHCARLYDRLQRDRNHSTADVSCFHS
jgi:hypothetical protein